MASRFVILLAVLLAGCVPEREPEAEPAAPTAPSPLAGSWVAEAFGGEIHERWEEQADGSMMKAEGYFIAGGDTSYSETVLIGEIGGATYLIAHPSPGGVKVWEQTAASPTGMTFENPNEVNPTRIVYVFSGDGAFTRTLHGREGGEEIVNELRFLRP